MNVKDKAQVEKKVKKLIKEVRKAGCDASKYQELGSILNEIANLPEYKELYNDAVDELMMAGVSLEKCGCDPIRHKIPADKQPKKPDL